MTQVTRCRFYGRMQLMFLKLTLLSLLLVALPSFAIDSWDELNADAGLDVSKQSYCYMDHDQHIRGRNVRKPVRPASVTKVYVTYWALKELGENFRFKTEYLIDGETLHILGDGDTFFVAENILLLLSKLNMAGYNSFKKITFSENFYLNWAQRPEEIAESLKHYFNTEGWESGTLEEYETLKQKNVELNLGHELLDDLDFSVEEISYSPGLNISELASERWFFQSSPLKHHLKEMNIYSNNFMASRLFQRLGGPQKFHRFMKKEFYVGKESIYFDNGAGFDHNYTTCALTLRLLAKLKKYLSKSDVNIKNILSVPGVDPGTLSRRHRVGSVGHKVIIAKTGTLRHTSTLAGLLYTNGGTYEFGIFNHTTERNEARIFQDKVVDELINILGGGDQIRYSRREYNPLLDSTFQSL